jgi:peptidoglycan/xylan/chitin deacetylase (PgdA/CDA1 family)
MAKMRGKLNLLARAVGHTRMVSAMNGIARARFLLCLTYHRVADATPYNDEVISATPEEFDWQMRWLMDNARVLSGDELVALAGGKLVLDRPAVCVTFDDGYLDNLHAARLMAQRGVPGVFFVTTGFIDGSVLPHHDRIAYSLKRTSASTVSVPATKSSESLTVSLHDRPAAIERLIRLSSHLRPAEREEIIQSIESYAGVRMQRCLSGADRLFMDWGDVAELVSLGHAVGGHTHSHPFLASLSPVDQEREVETGRLILEANLGVPIALFAYPDGTPSCFTAETKRIVQRCGFAAAFSFHGGRNALPIADPFDIKRVSVERETLRVRFVAQMLGAFPC